jgi:glycosyltransferase involved in cell wall biosynthesis
MRSPSVPFVSVVVPVLDGERTIGDCLRSLCAVEYPEERREIIVVDNGSRDASAAIIRRFPVSCFEEPRRGPANARNRGVAASRGDIIAFTDADCVASTQWLHELIDAFGAGVGGVAGEILPYPPRTPAERYAARIRHLSPQRYLGRAVLPFAVTANLAFRRMVFDTIGGFDPAAPRGGESTDFCTRFVRGTGLRLRYAPRAAVFHRHRQTAWALFRQQFGYGRGHAYLYGKYRDEIPWGWRQTMTTYRDLCSSASALAARGAQYLLGRAERDALQFCYFEFLRKLALRLGFTHQAWADGW